MEELIMNLVILLVSKFEYVHLYQHLVVPNCYGKRVFEEISIKHFEHENKLVCNQAFNGGN